MLQVKCQGWSESDGRVPAHAQVHPQPPHLRHDPLPSLRGVAVYGAECATTPDIGQEARVLGAQVTQSSLQLLPHLRDPGQEVLLHDGVEDSLQQDQLTRLSHPGIKNPV